MRELRYREGGYATVGEVKDTDIVPDDGEYYELVAQESAGSEQGSQDVQHGFTYQTTYQRNEEEGNSWTVTNALVDTRISATKQWKVGDETGAAKDVAFELQYSTDGGKNYRYAYYVSDYQKTANKQNNWSVTWEGLPTELNGQAITYRVIEKIEGDDWVQLNKGSEANGNTFTFVNTLTTQHTVTKEWAPEDKEASSVTVGLYRQVGEEAPELVDTATLSDGNSWTHTFSKLPRCDESDQAYTYFARELTGTAPGYSPVEDEGTITIDGVTYVVSYETSDDATTTTVTNAVRSASTEVTGTKVWNVADGTVLPSSIDLTLERLVAGGNWEEVGNVSPTWSDKEGKIWLFSFTGLPKYDENGQEYRYRVRETVPEGYEGVNTTDTRIVNYQLGGITLEKKVAGNRGEYDRKFTFTIELSDTSHASTAADAVSGEYDATFTDADDVTTKGKVKNFPAAGADEARDILRRLARESDGQYAIIYVEENLAQYLEHEIARYKDQPSPAIILIPGREGPLGLGRERILSIH